MAQKAYRTKLAYGDAATYSDSTSFTDAAKVLKIEPPAPEAADIDTTHLESEDETNETDPGWSDPGECKATVQYTDAQATALYGLYRIKRGWKITPYGATKVYAFTGHIKAYGTPIDEKGIWTNDVTIKLSGPMRIVSAS